MQQEETPGFGDLNSLPLIGTAADDSDGLESWSQVELPSEVAEGDEPVQLEEEPAFLMDRKRPSQSSAWSRGVGIDDKLFFKMAKLPRNGLPKTAMGEWSDGQDFDKEWRRLPMPWLAMPNIGKQEGLQGISPIVEVAERTPGRTPFHYKRLLAIRLAQTDDQLRAHALRRLRDLILTEPSQSQLGRALLDTTTDWRR